MKPLVHYDALVAEAMKVGWPVTFKTDLTTHDYAFLETRDSALPFAWMLCETGTHIVGVEWMDRRGKRAHDYVRWVEELGYPTRYYYWSGLVLEELPSANALGERIREHAPSYATG